MSDKNLTPVLERTSSEDLATLVDYILKASTTEELSYAPAYKEHNPDHKKYVDCIEHEIHLFGGNTLANMFRGNEGPGYFEIVCDVARKMGAHFDERSPIGEIELGIVTSLISKIWERMDDDEKLAFMESLNEEMSDEERRSFTESFVGNAFSSGVPKVLPMIAILAAIKMSGFFAYRMAVMAANLVAKAILGRGLALGANTLLTRWLAIFAGPAGWAIAGIWTVFDIASPAYRVTMPCVIHIAMLRRKYFTCKQCGAPFVPEAKYCLNCGAVVGQDTLSCNLQQDA